MGEMKYDRDLLAYKIRWEGGILATLEYGLRADDIADPALRATWQKLEEAYAELRALIDRLQLEIGVGGLTPP